MVVNMLTSIVGSLPFTLKKTNNLNNTFTKIGLYDPYKTIINSLVQKQINVGIDIISTGQVRGDMIEIFTKHIPGIDIENNTSIIKEKITSPTKFIQKIDTEITLFALKNTLKKSDLNLDEKNKKSVKGIITGPNTLVYSSRLDGYYSSEEKDKAIIDMAYALKNETIELEKSGVSMIQIDEPFLSTDIIDMITAYKSIKIISKDINIPVSLHACGNIENIFTKILNFPVDIIDCEFAGISSNMNVLESQNNLFNKKIGFGCVDTSVEKAESTNNIKKLLKKGIDIIGSENIIVDPDCGMYKLSEKSAFTKLNNMSKAVEELS